MRDMYLMAGLISFISAVFLTGLVRVLATKWRIVDDPQVAPERKHHRDVTPLLGGLAIIIATNVTWWILAMTKVLPTDILPTSQLIGLSLASLFIAIGGSLDDWRRMSPWKQLAWTLGATLAVIAVGIGVEFITNPLGGVLSLNQVKIPALTWQGTVYGLTLWTDLFTIVWLMGAAYTTKILDGLDGLVSGIGVIGSVIIFLLSMLPEVNQPVTGLLALSLAGACAGFLLWNWHPAKIFLGEAGSLFIGFTLGVLAIISGGKIATALLILGLPIVDLVAVILYRRFVLKQSPIRAADRSHLHFRLLDAGLSVRQTALLLYGLTALFGLSTLYVTGRSKVVMLAGVVVVTLLMIWWVVRRGKQRRAL